MHRQGCSWPAVLLLLFLVAVLPIRAEVKTANTEWVGTVYIRADGSIDPVDAPIVRNSKVYTLVGNISGRVVVERNSIIVDGASYCVQSPYPEPCVTLTGFPFNVTVRNFRIRGGSPGILVTSGGGGCTICRNEITDCRCGININCHGNIVFENVVTGCAGPGINLDSNAASSNVINRNFVAENQDGISLRGEYLEDYPSYCRICGNNIVNNSRYQVWIEGGRENVWDNGYPSGGNYYSNYNGTDNFGGPYKNETGSDGIGDTPYLYGHSMFPLDKYPLMSPYPSIHAVAAKNVYASRIVVCTGSVLEINATVANQGHFTENVSLTMYAGNITLATIVNITLEVAGQSTVTWACDVSSILKEYQNYTVFVQVAPVSGEKYLVDNNAMNGYVVLARLGDVNADRKVDIADISSVARWFGQNVPSAPINSDINSDDKIDIRDVSTVARHFGEVYG